MSCGRPAYVYDVHGADGWVTAESYDGIESDAFAGQAYPGIVDAERLRRDLEAYDPAMGHVNRQLILKHHNAETTRTTWSVCAGTWCRATRGASTSPMSWPASCGCAGGPRWRS